MVTRMPLSPVTGRLVPGPSGELRNGRKAKTSIAPTMNRARVSQAPGRIQRGTLFRKKGSRARPRSSPVALTRWSSTIEPRTEARASPVRRLNHWMRAISPARAGTTVETAKPTISALKAWAKDAAREPQRGLERRDRVGGGAPDFDRLGRSQQGKGLPLLGGLIGPRDEARDVEGLVEGFGAAVPGPHALRERAEEGRVPLGVARIPAQPFVEADLLVGVGLDA